MQRVFVGVVLLFKIGERATDMMIVQQVRLGQMLLKICQNGSHSKRAAALGSRNQKPSFGCAMDAALCRPWPKESAELTGNGARSSL